MKMFLKTRQEDPESYRKASPIHYAHKDGAPLLLVHGTGDKVVKPEQSETLAAALKKAGAPHQLVLLPEAPHTFALTLTLPEKDLRPIVFAFLDQHLK